ncbi:hypothetical protein OPIT5_14230 [Opitutaceae bacterium TAV5]|nr:hypothetical protein OPIT5_14230 [Opitutaceae bacterium TAV5]
MTEGHRQELLHAIVDNWDRTFDPGSCLLQTGDAADATAYESIHYALALLETAERSRVGRAEAILGRILDRQAYLRRIASSTPVDPASLGMILLLVWHQHHRRLSTPLCQHVTETIRDTAGLACKDAVDTRGIFVLIAAGEMSFDSSLIHNGLARLRDLRLTPSPADDFAANLIALHAIENHVRHPDALVLTEKLLVRTWRQIAQRPSGNPLCLPNGLSPLAVLFSRITCGAARIDLPVRLSPRRKSGWLLSLIVNPRLPDDIAEKLTASSVPAGNVGAAGRATAALLA